MKFQTGSILMIICLISAPFILAGNYILLTYLKIEELTAWNITLVLLGVYLFLSIVYFLIIKKYEDVEEYKLCDKCHGTGQV